MVDIIGKAKEKAKDIKNTVVDNTKDVVDAAKESFSAPTISSSSSSSVTYVPNSEKNNSDIEIEKVDSPLTEYTGSEQKIFSTNIKENDSIKNTVVDNTKDVVDAAKESFSAPTQSSSSSSSSITPNPTFTSSSSVTYVPNSEKNNSDIEIEKVDSPLTEYTGSEQKIFSTNIKENDSIKNTNYDSAVIRNLQIDKQERYDDKQNNEFFNPFSLSMKLWQNYYITWMNFYTGLFESFNRTIRNI